MSMTTRSKARPAAKTAPTATTPIAEWIAAGLGLALTLAVIGYLVVGGLDERPGPPELSVAPSAVETVAGGFVVPLTVRNRGDATAAAVEVVGTLESDGRVVETRRVSLAYVPGEGEAKAGLIFTRDPGGYRLRIVAEGYEEP